jgi:hypothetical protein
MLAYWIDVLGSGAAWMPPLCTGPDPGSILPLDEPPLDDPEPFAPIELPLMPLDVIPLFATVGLPPVDDDGAMLPEYPAGAFGGGGEVVFGPLKYTGALP